jgi:hypothetical protein
LSLSNPRDLTQSAAATIGEINRPVAGSVARTAAQAEPDDVWGSAISLATARGLRNFLCSRGVGMRLTVGIGCLCDATAVNLRRNCSGLDWIGEEDMVERTIGVYENLPALAANVFKLRHESREIAGWQGKQKPIAGPI